MAAVTICNDYGAQENKVCHCFHHFPIYLPWRDGTGCHGHCFWILSFKPAFSLSSFTFIKRLFNSSSLSAIRVVASAYLRLLIFLPAVLIPACASSRPVFNMNYICVYIYIYIYIHIHTHTHTHTHIYICIDQKKDRKTMTTITLVLFCRWHYSYDLEMSWVLFFQDSYPPKILKNNTKCMPKFFPYRTL